MLTTALKRLAILALPFLLTACAATNSSLTAKSTPTSPRTDTILATDWRFLLKDPPDASSATLTKEEEKSWQKVTLPHTWNAIDGQDGGDDYHRGPAWYRRHVTLTKGDLTDRRLYLKFDAASLVADVYVNGQPLGSHRGGFAAFCFDATPLLRPGDNTIAVRVDNSKFDDLPPISADFTFFGGLYRDVHLLSLDPVSVSPLDDASPGVYVRTDSLNPAFARITVAVKLRNASGELRHPTLRATILDATGKPVAVNSGPQYLPANSFPDAALFLVLQNPHLWQARTDPYLYTVTVDLEDDGKLLDRVTQPLGLRGFTIDPDRGFILNGHPYPLHGVNRHQDRLNKGWAISDKDHDEDFAILTELGATCFRSSHYQHAQHWYDLCDRGGLVAWAEIPNVNECPNTDPYVRSATQQLRELIKQNYNHPSIVVWGLGNEIRPLKDRDYQAMVPVVQRLQAVAKELDPSRPTAMANHRNFDDPTTHIPDVIAFNKYFGWYDHNLDGLGPYLDAQHRARPHTPIGISEYGAGAGIYQHALPTSRPSPLAGPWHPEEWQLVVHEHNWADIEARPWLWATFLWNAFDFASDARHEGDHLGRNDKGLVTYDRKTKKDAFYFYQAHWTTAPMVHIVDARYTPRPTSPVDVQIFSTCDQATLKVNGKTIGTRPLANRTTTWTGVALKEGKNKIEVAATKGNQTVTDMCTWTY